MGKVSKLVLFKLVISVIINMRKKEVFPQEYVQFFEKLHTINHFYSN